MGVLDLVGKAAKGAKKAAPFFSKADVVLDELPRGKGLGNEFLGELVKKGAKPTELRERGIEKALKDKPKMTKAEVQKVFESNPAPKVQEKVLTGEMPDYDEFLEKAAQDVYGRDYWELNSQQTSRLDKMYSDLPTAQYDKYKTPGGENYREILLKLPAFDDKRLMKLEAELRREETAYREPMQYQWFRDKVAEVQRLKEEKAAAGTPYISGHYRNDPNLLAHIRVQDFQAPTRGFAVVNTRSGNKSEVFPTMEQAQAYLAQMPESLQDMLRIDEAAGKPKKVLLVDEIQSDWHQEGRKRGYREGFDRDAMKDEMKQMIRERGALVNEFTEYQSKYGDITPEMQARWNEFKVREEALEQKKKEIAAQVPDAPFKKNWHELAMKRVLDYAAENGYDSIAITPGAEQAKRYDLSKQISRVVYNPTTETLNAFDNSGKSVLMQSGITPERVEEYIGKEPAKRLFDPQNTKSDVRGGKDVPYHEIVGEDLQVGGEGMKGFYDKILPDYLNNFGKPYGSSVGEMRLPVAPADSTKAQGYNLGDEYMQGRATWSEFLQANPDAAQNFSPAFHSFDITPQLREEVKNKGLPLYSKTGMGPEGLAAGSGAATIGSQMFDENNEQQVQNPVHFTENPDAMLLELMQRN